MHFCTTINKRMIYLLWFYFEAVSTRPLEYEDIINATEPEIFTNLTYDDFITAVDFDEEDIKQAIMMELASDEEKLDSSLLNFLNNPIAESGKFEGDIELPHGANLSHSSSWSDAYAAIKDSRKMWINGSVPYVISSNYGSYARMKIYEAIKDFHTFTCLNFIPRINQVDYLIIRPKLGCSSLIGKMGGDQVVSLSAGCIEKKTIIHELMHAVGFYHEQVRYDRDNYITIHWNNIRPFPNILEQFQMQDRTVITVLGEPYDQHSVMHYGSQDFARLPNLTTISAKNGGTLSNDYGFTKTDISKLNKLYDCPQSLSETTTTFGLDTTSTSIASNSPCADIIQLRLSVVDTHNHYRKLHSALPLLLDDDLNRNAEDWAQQFADSKRLTNKSRVNYTLLGYNYGNIVLDPMKPASDGHRNATYSSLAWYKAGRCLCLPILGMGQQVVLDWYSDEVKYEYNYDYRTNPEGRLPCFCTRFLQMVWKSSTKIGVGCALSADGNSVIIIANYDVKQTVMKARQNISPPPVIYTPQFNIDEKEPAYNQSINLASTAHRLKSKHEYGFFVATSNHISYNSTTPAQLLYINIDSLESQVALSLNNTNITLTICGRACWDTFHMADYDIGNDGRVYLSITWYNAFPLQKRTFSTVLAKLDESGNIDRFLLNPCKNFDSGAIRYKAPYQYLTTLNDHNIALTCNQYPLFKIFSSSLEHIKDIVVTGPSRFLFSSISTRGNDLVLFDHTSQSVYQYNTQSWELNKMRIDCYCYQVHMRPDGIIIGATRSPTRVDVFVNSTAVLSLEIDTKHVIPVGDYIIALVNVPIGKSARKYRLTK